MSRTDSVSNSDRSTNNAPNAGISNKDIKAVAKNLHDAEEAYLKALTPGKDGKMAADVEMRQQAYNRALRAYEAMQRLLQSAHETMMRVIQNIGR